MVWLAPRVLDTALSQSVPTPNTQELFRVVTSDAVGAPTAALPASRRTNRSRSVRPGRIGSGKLTTVIDDTTFCDRFAVTVRYSVPRSKSPPYLRSSRLRVGPLHQHPGQAPSSHTCHRQATRGNRVRRNERQQQFVRHSRRERWRCNRRSWPMFGLSKLPCLSPTAPAEEALSPPG